MNRDTWTIEELIAAIQPHKWEWFYLHTYANDLWYAEVGIQDSKDGLIQHVVTGKDAREALRALLVRIS